MEAFLYFFSGFLASYIGGVFPGAVNLNIDYTTLQKNAKAAIPLLLAAAIGEIVLSFLALHCGMAVDKYITNNTTIKLIIAVVLIGVGSILWFKKQQGTGVKKVKNKGFLKGFLLAVINPPVLVFWLIAFAYLSSIAHIEPMMSILYLTLLFFIGVFSGKVLVFYCYIKFSMLIAKNNSLTNSLNKVIAVLLLCIGIIQLLKIFI